MVTRRAVLKGTAAASIGAIAAAHGATPVAAEGYGELAGGAAAVFQKYQDAFHVSLKFHKHAADVFFKESVAGGVDVFYKLFDKHWVVGEIEPLGEGFPDLKSSELSFGKFDTSIANIFIKRTEGEVVTTALATLAISTDKISFDVDGDFKTDCLT